MALINGRLSEIAWYGVAAGVTYWGLTLYKPKYYFCMARVQRI